MCQPQPLATCSTIKANARLRRSRQWKDQSENKSPNNAAMVTPTKASTKNTRRRRRPTKKEQNKQSVNSDDDASTSTASTAPSSDESTTSSCASPAKKQSKTNNIHNKHQPKASTTTRRKRSKKRSSKSTRPTKIVNIVAELTDEEKSQYLALDAEMVGIGPGGFTSRLARISLVNYDGDTVYDTHVQVEEVVTDYRTFVSGITAEDLESEEAVSFDEARSRVLELVQDKVIVGHGLKNDFKVLNYYDHPWYLVRDTAKYEPFMKTTSEAEATFKYPAGTLVPKKLKVLAKDKLGLLIQEEGKPHSPVEDAVAALELFKKHQGKWEKAVAYKVGKTRAIESSSRVRSDSFSSLSE